jgi:hypothetical protein
MSLDASELAARPRSPGAGIFLALIAGVGALVAFVLSMGRSYDVFGGVILAPVLFGIMAWLAFRAGDREKDRSLTNIILFGAALKLAGAVARYVVAFEVYGGQADAARYDRAAELLYRDYQQGNFHLLDSGGEGTRFLEGVTGAVYALVGPTRLGAFFVFSFLGFLGLYGFYRGFRVGYPGGDHRRYAKLVFWLPSMFFWPSSIGKESWMIFTLGIACLGAGRLLARKPGGVIITALALWAGSLVRPHVALMLAVGLAVAFPFRRAGRGSTFNPIAQLVGIAVLVIAVGALSGEVADFLKVDRLDQQTTQEVLDEAQRRTTQGGSGFQATRSRELADIPAAAVTVLFRPFPFEARNTQTLVTAIEAGFILVLFVASIRRLLRSPFEALRVPYLLLAATFSVAFIFAFSSFGNFGIIARERTQVYPLVLTFLAVPLPEQARERREQATERPEVAV